MSKAAYWQRGESLDYMNGTTAVIEANTIIDLKTRIAVAGTSINPGEKGSVHVCGVYEIPKTGTAAVDMGALVYFDGNGITDAADNGKSDSEAVAYTPAGYAAQEADADAATVLVKLLG